MNFEWRTMQLNLPSFFVSMYLYPDIKETLTSGYAISQHALDKIDFFPICIAGYYRICKRILAFWLILLVKLNIHKLICLWLVCDLMCYANFWATLWGPCKVRNETETKRNETKQIKTKRNKSKGNETNRNETKQNETKQIIWPAIVDKNRYFLILEILFLYRKSFFNIGKFI